ncbi:MAG: hypothetical protein E6I52_03795 [Chloroflexi bacterium]|nr:MAG: hypothetical protein E6I52_03795 [Chloroflexota bacterium]
MPAWQLFFAAVRLQEALELTATATLRRIAGQHGLPYADSTTRSELIERIGERLLDAAYLDEQVRGLGDGERGVLLAVRARAGELRRPQIDRAQPGAAETLSERGLLFRVFATAGLLRGEVFTAPDELLDLLPAPPPAEPPPATESPPPAERRTSDPVFSLFALVSALTRRGGHLEREVRGWLVHGADGDPAVSPSLSRLLDRPGELAQRLWRAYLTDRGWSELAQAGISGHDDLADLVQLRQAVLDAFERLPENTWIRLDAFMEWVEQTRPALVREQLNARGLVELQSVPWEGLESPLLRYCLLGPLYWLGAVAVSADARQFARRPERAKATAVEACTWQQAPSDRPDPLHSSTRMLPKQMGILPEPAGMLQESVGVLLAPARARLGSLLQAERYLVLKERGRLSRYELVQSNVAGALSSGGSIGECRQLLTRLTQTELPEAITERLAAWERRFGALVVRPAVLIEARSQGELDDALAGAQLRPFLRVRLGPTVAEVAAADALELAARLHEAGHLPRVDAALRLVSEPRRAYPGLVDEQVLEFLLVSLLAFRQARPEQLAQLEGSLSLLDRLERQFPRERLAELHAAADHLAGELATAAATAPGPRRRAKRARRRRT